MSTYARTIPLAIESYIALIVTHSGKGWTGDVVEVRIAYFCVFIPPIRRVDGIGWLCSASLVDATSVEPPPPISVLLRLLAALEDHSIAITLANLLIVHFLPDPPMGQDHVFCCFVIAEVEDFSSTAHSTSLSN